MRPGSDTSVSSFEFRFPVLEPCCCIHHASEYSGQLNERDWHQRFHTVRQTRIITPRPELRPADNEPHYIGTVHAAIMYPRLLFFRRIIIGERVISHSPFCSPVAAARDSNCTLALASRWRHRCLGLAVMTSFPWACRGRRSFDARINNSAFTLHSITANQFSPMPPNTAKKKKKKQR